MQRGVYSAGAALLNAQTQLDVIAQNLANASTNGFKRDAVGFNESLMRQIADHAGYGREVGQLGAVAGLQTKFTDMSRGALLQTGNPFDLSVQGEGMFAVQTASGVRYTRDGSFSVNNQGTLVTKMGEPVLDNRLRPIGPLPEGARVSEDGTIGTDNATVGRIAIFQGNFAKQGENLFLSNNATVQRDARLNVGTLEGSNVNAVNEMIAMIKTQRIFEMAQRSVTGQEEMTQRLIQAAESR